MSDMAALSRLSKEIRKRRVDLREELRSEQRSVAEVLLDPIPDWLERVPIRDILEAPYRFPNVLLHQFLADCPIGELQPVGRATQRQREWLAGAMLSWEARRDESRASESRKARAGRGMTHSDSNSEGRGGRVGDQPETSPERQGAPRWCFHAPPCSCAINRRAAQEQGQVSGDGSGEALPPLSQDPKESR